MRMTRLWMVATALILLMVGGLVIASCGNTTPTTSAPSTTLAPPATTAQTTDTANPTATTAGGAVDAAALYSLVCAGCHPSLPRAAGGANQVRGVITMGKGYMPPFSGTLTVDQIVALATWVANGGQ
jgi:mono/diheme cytochrome c family protein